MEDKKYQLMEFYNGSSYDDGKDREFLLYEDIEPLVKLEADKIMCGDTELIKTDLVYGIEVIDKWKRFNLMIRLHNGLKGKRKFKCIEVLKNGR